MDACADVYDRLDEAFSIRFRGRLLDAKPACEFRLRKPRIVAEASERLGQPVSQVHGVDSGLRALYKFV